ncbi:MAG TPA: GrpB family protein [Meiothermus sp.]|nr:GrpB family protein [Meiothermus sp.]
MKQKVEVVDYDPIWPQIFEELKARIWPLVQDFALALEHVGSTAVPGLAAKPIIDLDVVIPSEAEIPLAVERLAKLGYAHLGNLGIEGREAFKRPPDRPAHNLYVCVRGSTGLQNHLALRDYLRANPEAARAYGELKKRLAEEYPYDIGSYVANKTEFIVDILGRMGLKAGQLDAIRQVNLNPKR